VKVEENTEKNKSAVAFKYKAQSGLSFALTLRRSRVVREQLERAASSNVIPRCSKCSVGHFELKDKCCSLNNCL
jgi:hypothetical protein